MGRSLKGCCGRLGPGPFRDSAGERFRGPSRHVPGKAVSIGFDGYAIGSLSVGESKEQMLEVMNRLAPRLPDSAPRYVMGVGAPEDLVEGVHAGVDMFDCVMPTRNARNGTLFTSRGPLHIKNNAYTEDPGADRPGLRLLYMPSFLARIPSPPLHMPGTAFLSAEHNPQPPLLSRTHGANAHGNNRRRLRAMAEKFLYGVAFKMITARRRRRRLQSL